VSRQTKSAAEQYSVSFWEREEQVVFGLLVEGKQILCGTIFKLGSGLARCWKCCLYNRGKVALHEKLQLKGLSAPLYLWEAAYLAIHNVVLSAQDIDLQLC